MNDVLFWLFLKWHQCSYKFNVNFNSSVSHIVKWIAISPLSAKIMHLSFDIIIYNYKNKTSHEPVPVASIGKWHARLPHPLPPIKYGTRSLLPSLARFLWQNGGFARRIRISQNAFSRQPAQLKIWNCSVLNNIFWRFNLIYLSNQ